MGDSRELPGLLVKLSQHLVCEALEISLSLANFCSSRDQEPTQGEPTQTNTRDYQETIRD